RLLDLARRTVGRLPGGRRRRGRALGAARAGCSRARPPMAAGAEHPRGRLRPRAAPGLPSRGRGVPRPGRASVCAGRRQRPRTARRGADPSAAGGRARPAWSGLGAGPGLPGRRGTGAGRRPRAGAGGRARLEELVAVGPAGRRCGAGGPAGHEPAAVAPAAFLSAGFAGAARCRENAGTTRAGRRRDPDPPHRDVSMTIIRMTDLDLTGKRVLIRQDLNVPIDNGRITSEQRITASVPTLKLALEKGAAVMVTSHLGRPKEGVWSEADSLAPVAARLSELLGVDVPLVRDWVDGVQVQPGQVVLLENCRMNVGEGKDDEALARKYAALCDVFVM